MINGNMPQVWLPEERPITVAKPVVQMNRMWNDMIRMNDDTWIGPDGTGLNGSIHSLCDLLMNWSTSRKMAKYINDSIINKASTTLKNIVEDMETNAPYMAGGGNFPNHSNDSSSSSHGSVIKWQESARDQFVQLSSQLTIASGFLMKMAAETPNDKFDSKAIDIFVSLRGRGKSDEK